MVEEKYKIAIVDKISDKMKSFKDHPIYKKFEKRDYCDIEIIPSVDGIAEYLVRERNYQGEIFFVINPNVPLYTGSNLEDGLSEYCEYPLEELNRGLDSILDIEFNEPLQEFRRNDKCIMNRILNILFDKGKIETESLSEGVPKKYIMKNIMVIRCDDSNVDELDELERMGILCQDYRRSTSVVDLDENLAHLIARWVQNPLQQYKIEVHQRNKNPLSRDKQKGPFEERFGSSIDHEPRGRTTIHISELGDKVRRFDGVLDSGTLLDGKYRIEGEPLGNSPYSVIYKVYDISNGEFAVAKCIKPQASKNKELLEIFRNEAEQLEKFKDYPKIVQLIGDHLEDHDQEKYFIMEYLDGQTLDIIVKKNKMEGRVITFGEACSYIHQMAEISEEIHHKRIVHRDVKPANIIIDENGEIKMMDFGISRSFGDKVIITGTPAFMSPEQVRGDMVDHKSDIYSLGNVLFNMLTGKLPYSVDLESTSSTQQLNSLSRMFSNWYVHLDLREFIPDAPLGLVLFDMSLRSPFDLDSRFDCGKIRSLTRDGSSWLDLEKVMDQFIEIWDKRGYRITQYSDFKERRKSALEFMSKDLDDMDETLKKIRTEIRNGEIYTNRWNALDVLVHDILLNPNFKILEEPVIEKRKPIGKFRRLLGRK